MIIFLWDYYFIFSIAFTTTVYDFVEVRRKVIRISDEICQFVARFFL